jgi:predicted GNAT family acetyltransferase
MIDDVTDNVAEHRYELRVGDDIAFLTYSERRGGVRALVHTEVPAALEGKGIGARLVRAALDDAEARRFQMVPVCPFVQSYLVRHPEYGKLISKD